MRLLSSPYVAGAMSGRIICGDSRVAIPDTPVQLVVTSPPYNVGIDYDTHEDEMSWGEWKMLVARVLSQAWHRLVPGGRMAVNIQHTYGRKPALPLGHHVEDIMLQLSRAHYMGAVIWDKSAAVGPSTAWGTWRSPRHPVFRGEYEMVYVMAKGGWQLEGDTEPDILATEFKNATADVWRDIGTTSQDRSGHPAAFPVRLAQRLIQLLSYPGQTVLDPFFGSGTTGLAAEATGRDWIGVDISEEYCDLAAKRIAPFEGMEVPVETYEDPQLKAFE